MKYVTSYAIGARKRKRNGINEDSVAVTLYNDGHRDGYEPDGAELPHNADPAGTPNESVPSETEHTETGVFDTDSSDDSEEETEVSSLPHDRTAGVFVLADGAGGEDAGDIASYLATTVIPGELSKTIQRVLRQRANKFGVDINKDALEDPLTPSQIEQAVVEAVNRASEKIVRYAGEIGSDGMYTTVVVGLKIGEKLHYGWVGDSRLYVVNESHDDIALLTKDHAKVQRLRDEGKIDEIEACTHPEGNRINRAVGGGAGHDPSDHSVRVDTGTVQLYRDDTVLLTSDGLIDAQTDARDLYYEYKESGEASSKAREILEEVVTDGNIRDVITEEPDINSAARRFIDFSNEKGGKDNLSVILFRDESLPSAPPVEGGLPEREYDPGTNLAERETVIDS